MSPLLLFLQRELDLEIGSSDFNCLSNGNAEVAFVKLGDPESPVGVLYSCKRPIDSWIRF